MLPLWRTIVGTSCVMLLGVWVDWALGLNLGMSRARWPSWILAGLACLFVTAISPATALLLLVLLLLLGRTGRRLLGGSRARPGGACTTPGVPAARMRPIWLYLVLGAALAGCFVRPRVPLYWDEFVWLAKARIESSGWAEIRRATLDPDAGVIPAGYPILWPASASWLSLRSQDAGSLLAGAAVATMVALWLFLDGIVRHHRCTGAGSSWPVALALGLVGLSPLVFVHLRTAYVDLPVGLLSATLTLALVDADLVDDGPSVGARALTPLAVLVAVVLTGFKDEGFAHVGAIVLAVVLVALVGRSWSLSRFLRLLFVLASAAIPFTAWRVLLAVHHVHDADHGIGSPVLGEVPRLARAAVAHALDLQSWGLLWPAALGVVVSVSLRPRRFRAATHVAVLALCAQGLALFGAMVVGPERVREFAFHGTLLNRLLVQLAPPSCVALLLSCEDAAISAAAPASEAGPSLRDDG